jgi:hypothetical protein
MSDIADIEVDVDAHLWLLLNPKLRKAHSRPSRTGPSGPAIKPYKSGLSPETTRLHCEEPETMEYLLYACENYSAKIWTLAGPALTPSPLSAYRRVHPGYYSHPTRNCMNLIHLFSITFKIVPHAKYGTNHTHSSQPPEDKKNYSHVFRRISKHRWASLTQNLTR